MKVSHFEEEKIYTISNHAVARNPIFVSKEIQQHFLNRMDFYLAPIANIIAYNLADHEFQITVKLKSRPEFISCYKNRSSYEKGEIIPESTYIFSRAMSNLQVSLVKKFNFLYKRNGTLMASRFTREKIESPEELTKWIGRMNNGKRIHSYSGIWANDIMKGQKAMTSKEYYSLEIKDLEHRILGFKNGIDNDLVGEYSFPSQKPILHPTTYHYRLFMKAMCKFQH
jgi:hypothetical protein